jgi:hypothetical protein
MVLQKKFIYMVLGGMLALALAFAGAAAFAQTDDNGANSGDSTQSEEVTPPQLNGRPDFDGARGDDGAALADALGITVEELQAAQAEARTAAIEQAVEDGLLTQEQADELLAGNGRFGRGVAMGMKHEYLADALGITVAELQAAQQTVQAQRLADMVESGAITQEQADLMAAQQAVSSYIDREALQATLQAAYEDAIDQALDDGAITQAQADALLSNMPTFGGRGFGDFGFGGHGGRHHGPGGGEFAPFQNQQQSAPADTASDA